MWNRFACDCMIKEPVPAKTRLDAWQLINLNPCSLSELLVSDRAVVIRLINWVLYLIRPRCCSAIWGCQAEYSEFGELLIAIIRVQKPSNFECLKTFNLLTRPFMPQMITRLPNVSSKQSLIGLETRIAGGKKQNNGTLRHGTYLILEWLVTPLHLFMPCFKHVIWLK